MADSEDLYCHEISRRSVARAALHLGIENMSQEALDVLADVLQQYVERIGKSLSQIVESSGRPSNHVNVFDTLKAIHMTTAPAAHQVHAGSDATPPAMKFSSSARIAPWQDLAVFCYGPKWEGGPKEGASGVGGKQGPSSLCGNNNNDGWRAPYAQEVPQFPQASDKVANPHRLQASDLSLHTEVAVAAEGGADEDGLKQELEDIPDVVFGAWCDKEKKKGVSSKKQAEEAKTDADDDEPPKKKARVEDEEEEEANRPSYVSTFMPTFPRSSNTGRTVVEDLVPASSATTTSTTDTTEVRSSLVNLGKKSEYWGSSWDAAPMVPVGRVSDKPEAPVVAPLGRASNARVSRILEGSMDTAY